MTGSDLTFTILGVANGLTAAVLDDAVFDDELVRVPTGVYNDCLYQLSPGKWAEMEIGRDHTRAVG